MNDASQLILDVRDLGENIASVSQDIQLLFPDKHVMDDGDIIEKAKHAKGLVDSILSVVTLFNTLDYKLLDIHDELSNEVTKIELSCLGLQSLFSQCALNIDVFHIYEKEIQKFLKVVNTSANRIATISFIAKDRPTNVQNIECFNVQESSYHSKETLEMNTLDNAKCSKDNTNNDLSNREVNRNGNKDYCYKDKATCELDCNGACYETDHSTNALDHAETFKDSTLENKNAWEKYNVHSCDGNSGNDVSTNEIDKVKGEDYCYKDKAMCELDCNGVCYEAERASNCCPQYVESFTESTLTHIENGYDKNEQDFWRKSSDDIVAYSMNNNENGRISVIENPHSDEDDSENTTGTVSEDDGKSNYDGNIKLPTDVDLENNLAEIDSSINFSNIDKYSNQENNMVMVNETSSIYDEINISVHSYEDPPTINETTNNNYEQYETTTESYEPSTDIPATTVNYYDSFTSYDSTYSSYESSSVSPEAYTTTETTTPAYETTTEDLYKVSQDIYSAAQDLSTKANEISTINSDISSKVSNINSMVSDLNTYDDDELTKKIQSVSKTTQEISSKSSEISSLCSTTSSLASDISSASSDMPSADRHHRFKTSPWQKMSAKCQEIVTACQSIVTAAQDILLKLDDVVITTADLRVADAVSTAVYEVAAKTQLVVSETLNIVSAVIELLSVIES